MEIEYEATFANINKDDIRERLKQNNATLVRPEFVQKRINFDIPNNLAKKNAWIRVRDEGDKVTLTYKSVEGDTIEAQKEILVKVDNFDNTVALLSTIGCVQKAYQVTKREVWSMGDVEIMIDEWPFLKPFAEVEGPSEEAVKAVSEKLGFDYQTAQFCEVSKLYQAQYDIPISEVHELIRELAFDGNNPFS